MTSLFYKCIQAQLKSWATFQLAISNSWGGVHTEEKAQWMVGELENYFNNNSKLEDYEVEEWISTVMFREFDVIHDDQSDDTYEVAKELCIFYSMWKQNKHDSMREKMMKLPRVNLADCENHDTPEETPKDDIADEIMMDQVEIKEEENLVDEDGFQLVTSKRKPRKRNN